MSNVKERPISFNDEMVRAVLDGRKTQTRRPIEPQPEHDNGFWCVPGFAANTEYGFKESVLDSSFTCPYGKPGDRLYARESFWIHMLSNGETLVRYAATEKSTPGRLRPSIHMPRSASRLTLEITELRAERVADISEEDAEAEGAESCCDGCGEPFDIEKNALGYCWVPDCNWGTFSYQAGFRNLWDSIYSKNYPFDSNPWVWVIGFKKIEKETV